MTMVRTIYPPFVEGRSGLAILVLRVFVGIAFMFHGSGKFHHLAEFAAEFQVPYFLAAAAAFTQLIGGCLLMLGLLTPLAALGVGGTVLVAVALLISAGEPFVNPEGHSWESAGFYSVACLVLLLCGPGRYSLDRHLLTCFKR